jgi:hypothetical protein
MINTSSASSLAVELLVLGSRIAATNMRRAVAPAKAGGPRGGRTWASGYHDVGLHVIKGGVKSKQQERATEDTRKLVDEHTHLHESNTSNEKKEEEAHARKAATLPSNIYSVFHGIFFTQVERSSSSPVLLVLVCPQLARRVAPR